MTIFTGIKVHRKNISTSIIPPVCIMAQNKANSNDTTSILDCVDKNIFRLKM
jgi:hypothetical protein